MLLIVNYNHPCVYNKLMKTIIITGVSSGIGASFLELAPSALPGYKIIGLTRGRSKKPKDSSVELRHVDITNTKSLSKTIADITKEYQSIDVLICNAGSGLRGSVEDTTQAEIESQFKVNLWPTLSLIQLVLPVMRRQNSGHIITTSSLASTINYPTLAAYGATKAFVEYLMQTLAIEVRPIPIRTSLLVAGAVKTKFGRSMVNVKKYQSSTYGAIYSEWAQKFATLFTAPSSADDAARGLIDLIRSPRTKKFIRKKDRRAYVLRQIFGAELFHRFFINRHMRG